MSEESQEQQAQFEIILTVDKVVIRPDMIESVTFTLDPGSTLEWDYWEFKLRDQYNNPLNSWQRDAAMDEMTAQSSWKSTFLVTVLEIAPVLTEQIYTFWMRATAKLGAQSSWVSVSIIMPNPVRSIDIEYFAERPALNIIALEDSRIPPPDSGTISYLWRYRPLMTPEVLDMRGPVARVPLPDETSVSSEYVFAMQTKYEYTVTPTTVVSYCAWTPDGGLKIIVAAPENVRSVYDHEAGKVRVSWTHPTPYGVDQFHIQYRVDDGFHNTHVDGAETNQVDVPADSIPNYEPTNQDPLDGLLRAIGNNGERYTSIGPRSPAAKTQYPDFLEAIILNVSASVDFFHQKLTVTNEWMNAEGAERYEMSIAKWVDGQPASHQTTEKHWTDGETITESLTYEPHYDTTRTYVTSVTPYTGSHPGQQGAWIPILTAVPDNIQFYYLHDAETDRIKLYAQWDGIPGATETTLYDIQLTAGSHEPALVATKLNQTNYHFAAPAEPGVTYSIRIRAQDQYTVPDETDYLVDRFGPFSESVAAGTGEMLSRTFVYDSAGRLGRATTGTRTTTYTYDVRDNLTEVDPS